MRCGFLNAGLMIWAAGCGAAQAALTPRQAAQLPPPAGHSVSCLKEIKPILDRFAWLGCSAPRASQLAVGTSLAGLEISTRG